MKALFRHYPILLLALWFAGMSVLLDRSVAIFGQRTTADTTSLATPAPWRQSRLFVDPDSYAWLSYARDLRASSHFRVRFTPLDNAPFGRAVHWAQLPVWGLCAIASALECAGIPPPGSLELAGRILLPLLGFLLFSGVWLFLRRRIPPQWAAMVVLAAAVTLFWDFHPLRPDHHGFHLAAAFCFALPLLFSSFGFGAASARDFRPYVLSGVFGGCALWLGATVFYFNLAAAAAALFLALLPRRAAGTPPQNPLVWRFWGLSGAASSLFFWLLEYAPNHFSMRLEVNHPLYALSFLGVGETLFWIARYRHVSPTLSPLRIAHLLLALAAAALLPALILFGPVDWYIPRSTLMLRLHARYIHEFLPLHVFAPQNGRRFLPALLLAVGPGLAALALLLVHAKRMEGHPLLQRRAFFALPFFAIFCALFLWQFRWEHFAALAAFLPVLTVANDAPVFPSRSRLLLALAVAAQLAASLWGQCSPLPGFFRETRTDTVYLQSFQHRAVALQFKDALAAPGVEPLPPGARPAVLAPNAFAPYLYYFAGIPAVSSLYWENLEGTTAAAAAFGDSSSGFAEAHRIVRERGITHLFMFEGAQDALTFHDLRTGDCSHPRAAVTLGGVLAGSGRGGPIPSWLGVDPELNRRSDPPLYVFVPPLRILAPIPFPLRIYTVRPE